MPELAEVEFYRRQWDAGLGSRIGRVALHAKKRIFRGTDTRALSRALTGAVLTKSEARGKRMLFCASGDCWLGLHLGMTGKMWAASSDYEAEKHDHLVLFQAQRTLVFHDARQFGCVQFHRGKMPPPWWSDDDPPEIGSAKFTRAYFDEFVSRHARAPIKAVLLMQHGFSGVGNWMADEILWRATVHPAATAGKLASPQRASVYRATRFVAREALRIIGRDFSDPPAGWLIHVRWARAGKCPRDGTPLQRATVGGRTTAWCARCQR